MFVIFKLGYSYAFGMFLIVLFISSTSSDVFFLGRWKQKNIKMMLKSFQEDDSNCSEVIQF